MERLSFARAGAPYNWAVRYAIGISLVLAALSPASGQSPASAGAGRRFEVVSIRAHRGTEGVSAITTQPGGRFLVLNFPLRDVIEFAFDIRPFQLVDAPRWIQSERFDINALTGRDEDLSVVAARPIIQMLLADRFQLDIERERRIMNTYSLVRVRADALGPALRPTAGCRSASGNDDRKLPACGLRGDAQGLVGVGIPFIERSNEGLLGLAYTLTGLLNTMVENQTGLTGLFDFTVRFNRDPTAPDGVSIFTAVQEQLGLKLEPRQAPVDVIVVKRIERPTEN
jgi:uncharacterized protein (TIGR03435 family)